jgi:hypothetical protein
MYPTDDFRNKHILGWIQVRQNQLHLQVWRSLSNLLRRISQCVPQYAWAARPSRRSLKNLCKLITAICFAALFHFARS